MSIRSRGWREHEAKRTQHTTRKRSQQNEDLITITKRARARAPRKQLRKNATQNGRQGLAIQVTEGLTDFIQNGQIFIHIRTDLSCLPVLGGCPGTTRRGGSSRPGRSQLQRMKSSPKRKAWNRPQPEQVVATDGMLWLLPTNKFGGGHRDDGIFYYQVLGISTMYCLQQRDEFDIARDEFVRRDRLQQEVNVVLRKQ